MKPARRPSCAARNIAYMKGMQLPKLVQVVCPHCDTTNRMPRERLADRGKCGACKRPLFEGAELSVTFVRTAVGPNTRPGLEIIRLIEKADDQGLALVRERAPFAPMASDGQIRFADQVVLIRAPFRHAFSLKSTS